MGNEIDLSPETICGTVIDTQEAIIAGKEPNEAQIRACQLANASEAMLAVLSELVASLGPLTLQSPNYRAALKASTLLAMLPKPL